MRASVLEFLLINHPLDCSMCDQAGECKLQEYSVEYGYSAGRFAETKVHKPRQVDLGPRIVLDNERCILCSRCIRFTRDVVGDDALGVIHRGTHSTLTAYPGKPFDNNYTLNTVDLCPVGALTSKDFRFRLRVWFLKQTKSLCPACATGCAHAEKPGTFTNINGHLQRFLKAVDPPGAARPEWEVLQDSVRRIVGQGGFTTFESLFNRMTQEVPALRGLRLLQPISDGVKALLKEDFTPAHVRKACFWLAPAIAMVPALLTVAVIPFGSTTGNPDKPMVIADLNIGILYTFGILSLGVYGVVLAGYAARSKYPLLGTLRSSAQMISYEVAMGPSVIPVFLLVGNLNLSEVIQYQQGGRTRWLAFSQPLALVILLVAAFAETNRLPFDLPESEQELVGGYNTEYSSMKFALFFLSECANMTTSAAMIVTLFFGGWTLPVLGLDQPATTFWAGLAHISIFLVKTLVIMTTMIWTRWMLPRFRYDQWMDLGGRKLVPLALANAAVTAAWLWQQTS
jgi:NADH-quinone oxidoreductase subunit H